MRRLITVCLLAVSGCASYTGVVPMGGGTYMLSKQAATGFPGLGTLKADIIQDASKKCAESGQKLTILTSTETQPPYILGNFPRAEITFTCS